MVARGCWDVTQVQGRAETVNWTGVFFSHAGYGELEGGTSVFILFQIQMICLKPIYSPLTLLSLLSLLSLLLLTRSG